MLMIANHAGFCFGVKRALELAEQSAPACTFGPIIHNPQVVNELNGKGVVSVDDISCLPPETRVIIRAHGIPKAEYDLLRKKKLTVIDATCPFVAKIHKMVSETDRTVIVTGKHEHPEVRGILGWVKGTGYAVNSPEEAARLPRIARALLVSQTTISEELFDAVTAVVKTRTDDLEIAKTICTATRERQKEAAEIAAKSDMMIVVGGKNSSNTQKLCELCRALCPATIHIETVDEIKDIKPPKGARIGLTAGASTPDCIFKEVVTHMNDIENKDQVIVETQEQVGTPAESDFMAEVEKTLVQIRPGQTITGKVVMIKEDEVGVDIGYKADGLVQKSDLSVTDVKIGDELEVEVVKLNDGEGNVVLSQKNIINRKVWDEIVAKSESGEFVHAVGKEAVKGGLLAIVNDIRAFIPASQLSNRYVEKIEDFVGQEMDLKIIEVDKTKKRIVASRKAVLAAEAAAKRKELWDTIEEGSVVKGTVRRLADFGAFVDIGGVDGLVHVAELSWGRVKHPSEVVSVGDEIEVKITRVDPEKERISLSMKALSPRPWSVATDKYPVGAIVEGKVVRITTFGAFVELEPGLDGLVHISQCAPARIEKVEDAVNVGDAVRVKVLDVNPESKRISLSIRQAMEDEALETEETTENYDIEPDQE